MVFMFIVILLTLFIIVVISSYAVTASNFQENSKGAFAKVNFHRVVLDEAHTIKNKNTRAAIGWYVIINNEMPICPTHSYSFK